MVPAGSRVQVPKQGLACLSGDVSLEDAGGKLPEQFAIAEDVSFGLSRKPLGFGPVCWELSPDEVIKEWDSPVRTLVGLGRLCFDFHDFRLDCGGLGGRGGLGPFDGLDR